MSRLMFTLRVVAVTETVSVWPGDDSVLVVFAVAGTADATRDIGCGCICVMIHEVNRPRPCAGHHPRLRRLLSAADVSYSVAAGSFSPALSPCARKNWRLENKRLFAT